MTAATSKYFSTRTAIEATLAGALATAFALVVFGPIWTRMSGPLGNGDMLATYVNADNWGGFGYATTSHFGFPLGMNLNYSPNIDITENSFAKLVDVVGGSPFLGINLLLFLSFPLVAVLTYLLLRMVSRGGPVAIALAVGFTMIPYHFGRGLGHTYLATMFAGVCAVILAVLVGMGFLPQILRIGTRARRVTMALLVALLIVATAWSGLYYAVFGVIFTLAAVVWRFGRRDSWRSLALNLIPAVSIAVLALIGFIPGLLTLLDAPPTSALSERSAAESVTFAGSLAMALVPAPISQLSGRYNDLVNEAVAKVVGAAPVESTALTNFGTWVSAACVVVFAAGWLFRSRVRRVRGTAVPFLGYLTAVAILFFVPWGLNFLFANFVSAQVRAWNRLLPVLLLLFIAGAMAVLARTRWDRLGVGSVVVALALLVVVLIEQVIPFRPAYEHGAAAGTAEVVAAKAYANQVNAAIPEHCGVLQLPYVQYPEQGLIEPSLGDYEHFVHGLVNDDKDFSYGAVKFTGASEMASRLSAVPRPAELDELRAQGFCGIHVDRRGLADNVWKFMEIDLTGALGPPVATGDDGLWQFFDLRAK